MTQLILQSTQGELVAYLPRDSGAPLAQPTSATIGVKTPASDSTGSPVAATIDSANQLTSVNAQRGTAVLSFAVAPTIVKGRLYLVTHNALSGPFYVQASAASGTQVFLADPLPCDLPAGTAFQGAAITLALTLAQTATVDTATTSIAQIEAQASGLTRRWDHDFRVVRQEFARVLTVPKLLKLAPEILRWRTDASDTLGEIIDAAYEYLIQDLEAQGYEIARINSPEKLNLPAVKRIRWLVLDAIKGPSADDTKEAESQYRDQMRMAQAGSRFWYDAADNNAPTGRQHPSEFTTAWRTR